MAGLSGSQVDFWGQSARQYDAFETKWNFYGTVADAMIRQLELEPGSRVLELACGTGACTLRLARIARDGSVVALDYSDGMLEVARENVAAAGVSNVTFVQGDAGDVSSLLDGKRFDFAICNSAFWHFPEPDRVLTGLRSLLAKNGVFALSLPHWVEGNGEARESLRAKLRELLRERGVSQAEIDSMAARRSPRRGDILELLGKFGFQTREVSVEFEVSKESRDEWRQISVFSGDRRRSWSLPGLDAASQAEVWDELDSWRRAETPRDQRVSSWRILLARNPPEGHLS